MTKQAMGFEKNSIDKANVGNTQGGGEGSPCIALQSLSKQR